MARLRAVEYSDIFDTTIRAEPADIPPMSIKIDETKWKSNKHRLPPRTHSVEKQSQIRQQCDKLLELGVIRHSTANEWSQVRMVPKPTPGEWRFTLDFVRLNDCTSELEGWPITLIRPLFQRLGTSKPKYFAKLDLTAGYHQARLHEASCVYTAFRRHVRLVSLRWRLVSHRWRRRRHVRQQREASFRSARRKPNLA